MSKQEELYAHDLSLKNLIREAEDFCYKHDLEYDDPGDKDGCIFCVDGMMQLTPAGEKFKDIVTERRWTQYG